MKIRARVLHVYRIRIRFRFRGVIYKMTQEGLPWGKIHKGSLRFTVWFLVSADLRVLADQWPFCLYTRCPAHLRRRARLLSSSFDTTDSTTYWNSRCYYSLSQSKRRQRAGTETIASCWWQAQEHFDGLNFNIRAIVSLVDRHHMVAVTVYLFICSSPPRPQYSSVELLLTARNCKFTWHYEIRKVPYVLLLSGWHSYTPQNVEFHVAISL